PEITDLAQLLIKMGARIEGAGTSTIRVHGVTRLHGATHAIIPDRIEAGTFLAAGAVTGGSPCLENCAPGPLSAVLNPMEEAGGEIKVVNSTTLQVSVPRPLAAVDMTTEEYPGFPTDMQAQFMALMTQAEGASVITETIFENRFMHAPELVRMGAQIRVDG